MFKTPYLMVMKSTLFKFKPSVYFLRSQHFRSTTMSSTNKDSMMKHAGKPSRAGSALMLKPPQWGVGTKLSLRTHPALYKIFGNFHAASLLLGSASCACVPCLLLCPFAQWRKWFKWCTACFSAVLWAYHGSQVRSPVASFLRLVRQKTRIEVWPSPAPDLIYIYNISII